VALVLAVPAGAETVDEALRAIEGGRYAQAAAWLKPMANEGNPAAQFRLGNLYYHGQGLPEDEVMAVFWWKKAAAHGNPEAMFQLAGAYLFGLQAGKFVADPDREAAVWYFQAASAGHVEAQYHLGLLFLAGKGVIESRKEAAHWFRKAAEAGHVEAKKALNSVERSGR
jgi:TPR repeat protein